MSPGWGQGHCPPLRRAGIWCPLARAPGKRLEVLAPTAGPRAPQPVTQLLLPPRRWVPRAPQSKGALGKADQPTPTTGLLPVLPGSPHPARLPCAALHTEPPEFASVTDSARSETSASAQDGGLGSPAPRQPRGAPAVWAGGIPAALHRQDS